MQCVIFESETYLSDYVRTDLRTLFHENTKYYNIFINIFIYMLLSSLRVAQTALPLSHLLTLHHCNCILTHDISFVNNYFLQ